MILDGYLGGGPSRQGGFAQACATAGGWYGLDLFAGTGINWSMTRGAEINGSALIALQAQPPPATKIVLAEKHPQAFKALSHRVVSHDSRVALFNSDANEIIGDMLALVPRRAPAFAFLDPEGSELEWPTVAAVANHKRGHHRYKIEQLILFPTDTGFVRLAPEHPQLITRMFGHERWKEIHARREAGQITPEQARGEYVRLYGNGLKDLGYGTVLDRQIKKSNGRPMYFLIFATDNDAGEKIMDWTFDHVRMRVREELGQTTLFHMKSAPRKRRLKGS